LGIVASGVQGFSPLDLSPALWLDAADTSTITASSGSVSQWDDKSGNGRNVTQATGSAQPTTGSTTQNGLNTLSFDGNDWLRAATASDWTFLHDGTLYLVGAVAKFGNTNNPATEYGLIGTGLTGSSGSPAMALRYSDSLVNDRLGHLAVTSGVDLRMLNNSGSDALPANSYRLVTALADPGNATAANRSRTFVGNGSAITNNTVTGTPSTASPHEALVVGGQTSTFLLLVGQIAEIVIVSGANASEANRVLLRDYLATKWGL